MLAQPVLFAWPGFGEIPPDPGISALADLYAWTLARLPSGSFHLVAQSMGGALAARLAIEHPERVLSLVLCGSAGGADISALACEDWRPSFRAELPDVPDWFETDRTDLTQSLGAIRAPTLVLYGDADPICPAAAAELVCRLIPFAKTHRVRGGHDFANKEPDEVAELIRRHMVEIAEGGSPRRRKTTGFY